MAAGSLLALLDDITAILDDVAAMTKTAAGKTAGVVGDDLALNAQQVLGTPAERELPVVWAVAKGSLINKVVLVPAALLMSAFTPFLIMPLLMLGGLYLCYEGAEKVLHRNHAKGPVAILDERTKIKGAIRTDFILSAEIIIIALGIVAASDMTTRILVLSVVAIGITVIVYGLVGAIVKMDDAGLYLSRKSGPAAPFGRFLIAAAPVLMRILGVVGTAAMFAVGGQILLHGIPLLHHATEPLIQALPAFTQGLAGLGVSGVFGLLCGAAALLAITAVRPLLQRSWRG